MAAPETLSVVVMGVSASGKTTLAELLAERLGWELLEGDDLHPPANVAKMSAGTPLDDADRWPWLAAVAAWISEREALGRSCVVTCSALKRSYRDVLRAGNPSVWFVHVTAPPEVLRARLARRTGHFMPASLLESQLDALEPLAPDEPGTVVDAEAASDALVERVAAALPR